MSKYNRTDELSGRNFKNEKMIESVRAELLHLETAAETIYEAIANARSEIDVKKVEQAAIDARSLIERIGFLKGLYS